MSRKCFLCTEEFEGSESMTSVLSSSQSLFMLFQVFGIPPDDTAGEDLLRIKFQNVCYCSKCLEMILNLSSLAAELEILEEKVSTEKRNVIESLRHSSAKISEEMNGPPGMLQLLRIQIIEEMEVLESESNSSLNLTKKTKEQKRLHSKSTQTKTANPQNQYHRSQTSIEYSENSSGCADSGTLADAYVGTADENKLMIDGNDRKTRSKMKNEKARRESENATKLTTQEPKKSSNTTTARKEVYTKRNRYGQDSRSPDRGCENVSNCLNSNNRPVADSTGTDDEINLRTAPNDGNEQVLMDYDEDDSVANVRSASVLNMNIISFKKEKTLEEINPIVLVDPLATDVVNFDLGTELDNMEIQEQIQNKSYICGTCDEKFDDYATLEAHDDSTHNNLKNRKSSENEKQNIKKKRKKSVRADKKRDRTSGYYKPKKCEECGKILSHLGSWKSHVLTIHRQDGKYNCELCDYSCRFPSDLKTHMTSRHSDVRNFECDLCKKTFKRMRNLKAHQTIHEGNTPFECKLCSAKFNYAASLRRHKIGGDCIKVESPSTKRKKRKKLR